MSGDTVDKVDGLKYACSKKPICPICPHKWFCKKDDIVREGDHCELGPC